AVAEQRRELDEGGGTTGGAQGYVGAEGEAHNLEALTEARIAEVGDARLFDGGSHEGLWFEADRRAHIGHGRPDGLDLGGEARRGQIVDHHGRRPDRAHRPSAADCAAFGGAQFRAVDIELRSPPPAHRPSPLTVPPSAALSSEPSTSS